MQKFKKKVKIGNEPFVFFKEIYFASRPFIGCSYDQGRWVDCREYAQEKEVKNLKLAHGEYSIKRYEHF